VPVKKGGKYMLGLRSSNRPEARDVMAEPGRYRISKKIENNLRNEFRILYVEFEVVDK
jgi:hypothetical protein